MNTISNELFKDIKKSFTEHLDVPDNSRIIFSGKFGHGKTTFLRHYFKDVANDKYNPLFLYPVNYSVSANEDIFEYIKYDILVEMIRSEKYEFKCDTSDFWENVPFHIYKQPEKVISIILGMIPQLGKTAKGIFDELVKLKKDLKESFEKYKKEQDDFINIKEFLEDIEVKPGSIYDNGITTNIIRNAISQSKERDNKENVLIIDDLDRIDPEHIFRILNVFAAHFDSTDTIPNKFGFDKIIVVCDIENVRNIFKAKYGSTTDFNGYIDKFYSHKIFDYDIKGEMLHFSYDVFSLSTMSMDHLEISNHQQEVYKSKLFRENGFFSYMFGLLIDSGEIDMRNIVKWANKNFNYSTDSSFRKTNREFRDVHHMNILAIQLLCDIKGGHGSLKSAINSLKIVEPLREQYNLFCSQLAYIYLFSEHRGEHKNNPKDIMFNIGDDKYQLYLSYQQDKDTTSILTNIGDTAKLNKECFIYLFNEVVDMISTKQIVFS